MPALKYRDPTDGQFKYYTGPQGPQGPPGATGPAGGTLIGGYFYGKYSYGITVPNAPSELLIPYVMDMANGWSISGTELTCSIAGKYHIVSVINAYNMNQTTDSRYYRHRIQHLRSAAVVKEVAPYDNIGMNSSAVSSLIMDIDALVGDTVHVGVANDSPSGPQPYFQNAYLSIATVGGPKGDVGPQGPQGPPGGQLISGGSIYQQLAKKSSTDYDAEWSTPLPAFANYADLLAKWPTTTIGNTAITYDNGRLYTFRGTPWNMWMPTQGQVLYHAEAFGDSGSTNTGGPFTIVQYSIAAYPYPVNLSLKAIAEWGYGAANTSCACYLKRPDGFIYDTADQSFCNAGYWKRDSLIANVGISANGDPNACVVIDGRNFNAANCYRRARLDYTVMSI